jgi:hypothetical protein
MAVLTATEIMDRERTKELLRSLRSRARSLSEPVFGNNTYTKAFEETGCTCNVSRGQLGVLVEALKKATPVVLSSKDIIDQLTTRTAEELDVSARAQYGSNTTSISFDNLFADTSEWTEFKRLKAEIHRIDQAEHPALDKAARAAAPSFSLWLMEDMDRLGLPDKELCEAYAQAYVLESWRPMRTVSNG